jgi:hypothetical protein
MSAKKKRFCAHGRGCDEVVPRKGGEYCPAHRCAAFSVAYGQCVMGADHWGPSLASKHMNKEGDEWG